MEIINLAKELERLRATSKDIVTPTRSIYAIEDGGTLKIDVGSKDAGRAFPLTHHAQVQVSEKLKIPADYMSRMLETKEGTQLAANNVNHWLNSSDPKEKRMVRIADGKVRALLSDRYRVMDNYDLAIQVMDRCKENGAQINACELTETRMYIKTMLPHRIEEVKSGDKVVPGLMVSNSEVGNGAFRVEPFAYRLVCKNGMIRAETVAKVHIGGRLEIGQFVYRDDTLQAQDTALWRQVRDLIDGTFNGNIVKKIVDDFRIAEGLKVEKPVDLVDVTAKDLTLSEDHKKSLLNYFMAEGSTQYGYVNGITRLAQDFTDYDKRIELERYAGQKLESAISQPLAVQ